MHSPKIVPGVLFGRIARLVALVCLLWGNFILSNAAPPICIKGVADLRSNDFDKVGAIQLDGEWEFYWKQLLPVNGISDSLSYTAVPGMWAASSLDGQGYATYRLRILLPHGLSGIGLKVPELSTAYTLWVNGVLHAQNGTVSTIPDEGQAAYSPQLLYLHSPKDTLDLVMQVSNYHFYSGGVPQPIIIGSYPVLESLHESQLVYGAMLFGILLIIGLFHLAIYFFRPKETYNLYYSLYCLLLAANTLFVTERWLFSVCGQEMWPLLYRVFISTIYLVLLVLILFYSAFFQPVIANWVKRTMSAIFIFQALLVIILPTQIGSWLEPIAAINLMAAGIIAIFIFAKAIWMRKDGAIPIAICNVAFLVSFILDGFLSSNQISGIHLSHYMTVMYVITISLILSRRIASAFNNVETLSTDLQSANENLIELNKNLEAEVRERTRQVIQQEKMAALGQLTANIAHEINTPMGAIKASVETLSISYRKSVELFPAALEELTMDERDIILGMMKQLLSKKEIVSSREERQRRQVVIQLMEEAGIPDAQAMASKFSHAGIFDFDAARLALLRKPGIGTAMAYLFENFEQITSTQNIQSALDRVSKIMFAIKLYSRGGKLAEKSEVHLEQEIQSVIILYGSWFKKGILLQTDFGSMPPLVCFADELPQVWTNLILNAVQAMGNEGTLQIATRQVGNNAVITIADSGPGIPPEVIGKIFDPFFTTKVSGEGSGLGLDIVRTILKRHDGDVTVSSQPGRTVFTVTIPYPST
jgi:signal transduction histidine kinase